MVFVNVFIHFRIWTRIRIRNPRVTDPDPAKVPDPCGSGSTTLFMIITTSFAETHHFYAAPAPIKNVDAAPDPAAPAPTLLYI
jgi:hypothetical protein